MKLLSLDELEEGMICNQTICDNRGTILISRGATLTASYIRRLRKFGAEKVWIQEDPSEGPPATENDEDFSAAALTMIHQLTEEIRITQPLKTNRYAAKIAEISYSVLQKTFLAACLSELSRQPTLYKHSLRTMIISLAMGVNKRYDRTNLEYLATCALLHDIGFSEEFCENDHTHPLDGFRKLRDMPEVEMIIALSCLQHHERFDGKGFPLHLVRQQSCEFSRLLAVADAYDRHIIAGVHPRPAVFKIIAGMGTLFDPVMVRLFETTLR